MLLSKIDLYPQFVEIKNRVEKSFNLFANIEIVRRSSCDRNLPEDIALVVFIPYLLVWYESKGKTGKLRKEFFSLHCEDCIKDEYNTWHKYSETLEFQRVTFLRPYNFEGKDCEKLYASSSDLNITRDGCYFDFQISELNEIIQIPEKIHHPNIKKKLFQFNSDSFDNCLLAKKVTF
jgi:hypothetical protein